MGQLTADQEAALKEYESLRSEIIARVVMRDQMINYSATLFAAVIGVAAHVGFEANKLATTLILLAYPPVALVFAHGWATHDMRIWQIGQFIRICLHDKLKGLEWEDWLQRQRSKEIAQRPLPQFVDKFLRPRLRTLLWDRRQNWFAAGAFVGTSFGAVLLALVVAFFEMGDPAKPDHISNVMLQFVRILALTDLILGLVTFRQIWTRSASNQDVNNVGQSDLPAL